jgi:hypothetical protein
VSVMIDRYFGLSQHVLRSGLWARMKPGEQNLYVCLMHESERYSTRKLTRTDAALRELTGLSSRTFCNSRKKLREWNLITCTRGQGNVYCYEICNPQTGRPWDGDPKQRVVYQKTPKHAEINGRQQTDLPTQSKEFGKLGGKASANGDGVEKHGFYMKFEM